MVLVHGLGREWFVHHGKVVFTLRVKKAKEQTLEFSYGWRRQDLSLRFLHAEREDYYGVKTT